MFIRKLLRVILLLFPFGSCGRLAYASVLLGSMALLGFWYLSLIFTAPEQFPFIKPDRLQQFMQFAAMPDLYETVQLGMLGLLIWLNLNVTLKRLKSLRQNRLWAIAVMICLLGIPPLLAAGTLPLSLLLLLLLFWCVPLGALECIDEPEQNDTASAMTMRNRRSLKKLLLSSGLMGMFTLQGRSDRLRFWKVFGGVLLVGTLIIIPVRLMNLMGSGFWVTLLIFLLLLVLGFLMVATNVQRLRDLGQSGHVLFLSLPPFFVCLLWPLGFFNGIYGHRQQGKDEAGKADNDKHRDDGLAEQEEPGDDFFSEPFSALDDPELRPPSA